MADGPRREYPHGPLSLTEVVCTARGVLVAPELAPQARVLLENRGYDFVALDEVLSRCGEGVDLMRLF